jgi:Flp pilus assembly protein TadG
MLPFLLLLLLGVIEIGRYSYAGILVGNAARAGAAYGAEQLGNSCLGCTGIQQAAQNDYLNNGQDASTLTVTFTVKCGCDSGGVVIGGESASNCYPVGSTPPSCPAGAHWVDDLWVTASGTFTALFGYPGIPSPITISRTATMRIAQK